MKYFSLKYLIKTFLGVLAISGQTHTQEFLNYSMSTHGFNNCLNCDDCQSCKYCIGANGTYTLASQPLTDETIEQRFHKPYNYNELYVGAEKDNPYICVPWNLNHCEDATVISEDVELPRAVTNLYTQKDGKYIPMSITYKKYVSADGRAENMDIYAINSIIHNSTGSTRHNYTEALIGLQGSNNMLTTVQTDYILPMRSYKSYTLFPLNDRPHVARYTTKCRSKQVCYMMALKYLIQNNLCWHITKVQCLFKQPITGQQAIGSYLYNQKTLTNAEYKVYRTYANIPLFADPNCYIDAAKVTSPDTVTYLSENSSIVLHPDILSDIKAYKSTQAHYDMQNKHLTYTDILQPIQQESKSKLDVILGSVFVVGAVLLAIIGLIICKYRQYRNADYSATTQNIPAIASTSSNLEQQTRSFLHHKHESVKKTAGLSRIKTNITSSLIGTFNRITATRPVVSQSQELYEVNT